MKVIYIVVGALCFFLLFACEDVIDLELEEAQNQITVNAFLDNLEEVQTIRLTRSQAYFDNGFAQGISGADVRVFNENVNMVFEDQGDGNYILSNNPISDLEIGTELDLEIELEGKTLRSSTIMHRSSPIDSINQEDRDDIFGTGIFCNFFSRDPSGRGDTYWIKTFKNDVFLNKPSELNVAFDAGFDSGAQIDGIIFIPPIRELMNPVNDSDADSDTSPWAVGDVARVEIHSLNNDVFKFMESVRDQLLNSQNGIFAEPLSNSSGNIINATDDETILGVFNVAVVSTFEYEIE